MRERFDGGPTCPVTIDPIWFKELRNLSRSSEIFVNIETFNHDFEILKYKKAIRAFNDECYRQQQFHDGTIKVPIKLLSYIADAPDFTVLLNYVTLLEPHLIGWLKSIEPLFVAIQKSCRTALHIRGS